MFFFSTFTRLRTWSIDGTSFTHMGATPSPSAFGRARYSSSFFATRHAFVLGGFFDLRLVPETCRGNIISLATVALLAIDISTPDVSVSPLPVVPP